MLILVFFYFVAFFFFLLLIFTIFSSCRVNIWIKLAVVNFILVAKYIFFFLMVCRWMHTFGPEATQILVEHTKDVLLTSSEVEEALEDPQTLSLRSRFFVLYVLLFTAFSFFGLGTAIFVYSGDPVIPYPEMDPAYAKGPLLVLPERVYSVHNVVSQGPLLAITWPYSVAYPEVALRLGATTFREWLPLLLSAEVATDLIASGEEVVQSPAAEAGIMCLTRQVLCHFTGGTFNTHFVPGMFSGLSIQELSPLLFALEPEVLETLSGIYPSLHPACLVLEINASEIASMVATENYVSPFTGVLLPEDTIESILEVPAELSPSPWGRWNA